MKCAWPSPCDEYPEPRRTGSMLRYCEAHEMAVEDNRRAILSPPENRVTDPKFLKYLAAEKKRKKT